MDRRELDMYKLEEIIDNLLKSEPVKRIARKSRISKNTVKKYKADLHLILVAILAEQGKYIASERTFYRILNMANMLHHRGNNKPSRKTGKPDELKATGPDQVWCWDITFLRTPVYGLYFYCYMIKDIWTKEFVNWYNTEHRHSVIGYVTPT